MPRIEPVGYWPYITAFLLIICGLMCNCIMLPHLVDIVNVFIYLFIGYEIMYLFTYMYMCLFGFFPWSSVSFLSPWLVVLTLLYAFFSAKLSAWALALTVYHWCLEGSYVLVDVSGSVTLWFHISSLLFPSIPGCLALGNSCTLAFSAKHAYLFHAICRCFVFITISANALIDSYMKMMILNHQILNRVCLPKEGRDLWKQGQRGWKQ